MFVTLFLNLNDQIRLNSFPIAYFAQYFSILTRSSIFYNLLRRLFSKLKGDNPVGMQSFTIRHLKDTGDLDRFLDFHSKSLKNVPITKYMYLRFPFHTSLLLCYSIYSSHYKMAHDKILNTKPNCDLAIDITLNIRTHDSTLLESVSHTL